MIQPINNLADSCHTKKFPRCHDQHDHYKKYIFIKQIPVKQGLMQDMSRPQNLQVFC